MINWRSSVITIHDVHLKIHSNKTTQSTKPQSWRNKLYLLKVKRLKFQKGDYLFV